MKKLNKNEINFAIRNGLNPLLIQLVRKDWESYTFYHTKLQQNFIVRR
ncbi:hypothetical protein [Clostridium senegalense]